jgi:glycine cleavage system transcriptional repressor
MQLVITVLGNNKKNFIAKILPAVSESYCKIIDIRATRAHSVTSVHALIEGNWNQIAKFEATMENLQHLMDLQITMLRPEKILSDVEFLPYTIETISTASNEIIEHIATFLDARNITIEEIAGSQYQAAYLETDVFSTKFIIFIPPELRILTLREEFLDFCDQLNIDAILEPIKR